MGVKINFGYKYAKLQNPCIHFNGYFLVFSVIPVFEAESDMPHDMNATDGDTATFTCNAKGKPEAEVQWFKNGALINCKCVQWEENDIGWWV